jgi:fibro-slime domain-containing protein
MKKNAVTTVVTYCILALAGVVSFVLPDELVVTPASASGPATIRLPGVVRDFQKTNTNFVVAPSGGNGHYAGNVALQLASAERPVYIGGGYKVAVQWRDINANPIAPHLYSTPGNGPEIRLVNPPTITGSATIDTFNSALGPYGGSNIGPAPAYKTGSTMPVLVEPTGLGPLVNEVIYDGNLTGTRNTSVYCNKFLLRNYYVLRISGNLTILCNEEFKIENFAKLEILPNSSLKVYFKKDFAIQNNVDVNINTTNPQALQFFNLGTTMMNFENGSRIYCRVESPNATVLFKNSCNFYGSITAKHLDVNNTAGVHIDVGGQLGACNVVVNDTVGTKGPNSSGGIPSAAAFDTWFRDVMNVNLSAVHAIQLVDNGSGVYEFTDNAFQPIDNQLYGNEGMAHNYYFTYVVDTTFTYNACSGQFFEFEGSDDAWVFINNKLAIDLGGVIPGTRQHVTIDRLALTPGQKCTLHLFFAQRNASISRFRMRTNIELQGEDVVYTMSGGMD